MNANQAEETVWDWWPLARFAIAMVTLTVGICFYKGWHIAFRDIPGFALHLLAPILLLAMVSYGLAHLYLLALTAPVIVAIKFNDWYYDLSTSCARRFFRVRSDIALRLFGFLGEMALFAWSVYLLHTIFCRLSAHF